MIAIVLAAVLQAPLQAPLPADSAEAVLDDVRRAQQIYERAARRYAPTVPPRSRSSSRCDEIVGRFCLYHDSDDGLDRPEEPPEIAEARGETIEILRGAFARMPGDRRVVGPLLRYLVEDERADEAVSAARSFAALTDDSVSAALLRGFALHAAGEDEAAERDFDRALDWMSPEERSELESVATLLDSDERGGYEALTPEERQEYEAALWTLADPLYLTPGNERRAEHFARHVWSRLSAELPHVHGMFWWGDDLAELTLRYGRPVSRARYETRSLTDREFVEWYDSAQLAYLPAALRTAGLPETPDPWAEWPLEDERARSQFAPATVRRMIALEHRLVRFPAGADGRIRLYARLPLDSIARDSAAAHAEIGLFVLDSTFARVHETRAMAPVTNDTIHAAFDLRLPPGEYVYSIELLEPGSRLAGRARYRVRVPRYADRAVALSDVSVHAALGSGRGTAERPTEVGDARELPPPAWKPRPGDTIAVYAEAHGLTADPDAVVSYGVDLTVREIEDPTLVGRAARWIGRRIGLVGEPHRARISWEESRSADSPVRMAVDVPLEGLEAGIYEIEVRIRDRIGGAEAATARRIRIQIDDG